MLPSDNLIILVDHLKCAAYELPFRADETFGENDARDILEYLEEEGVLHENRERYHVIAFAVFVKHPFFL